MGIVWTDFERRIMLSDRQMMNPMAQRHQGVPESPFIFPRQKAKPVSKHPAVMSSIQFMVWG